MSDFANKISKQDSSKGPAGMEQLAVIKDAGSNNTWMIELDADERWLNLKKVDNAGALITTSPSIKLDLEDLDDMIGSSEVGGDFVIKLRETKACDDEGATVYAMVLRSKFYSTPLGADFT